MGQSSTGQQAGKEREHPVSFQLNILDAHTEGVISIFHWPAGWTDGHCAEQEAWLAWQSAPRSTLHEHENKCILGTLEGLRINEERLLSAKFLQGPCGRI